MMTHAERVRHGDRRALARLMTLLERDDPGGVESWQALYPHTGRAHRIGLTGPPGAGKSTLASQLAVRYRGDGQTVGIVAVDPTSPLTGGALLGDRVRMSQLTRDPGVFVRSMASRGRSGGLASQTAAVADVLDAAGMDVVLIETVGVGQDAIEVVGQTHTTVVVGAPGQGDEVQALKAGLFELADIFAVNQADREGADQLAAAWRWAIGPRGEASDEDESVWEPPIVQTVATTGAGVPNLRAALDRHRAWLHDSGAWARRATIIASQRLLRALADHLLAVAQERAQASGLWDDLIAAVAARRLDPIAAVARLVGEA